jgi:tetratricopeptide (TPR) repeat protein
MDLHLMIGLLGLVYILLFGGMSLLRREGLSAQFAVESIILTAVVVLLILVLGIPIHPVLFILLIYVVTMRIRILVDLANSFARRGKYDQAEKIYMLAYALKPDQTNKLIIDVNRAVMLLQERRLDEAVNLFTEILGQSEKGYLGVKYEAAAHFNLGVAYQRQGNQGKATIEFNAVIDTWPGSLYAQRAQQALDRQHPKEITPVEEHSSGN